jgi:flavin reductase (DIM6/NTAB) family NADH-FMN oxidoreductase RutF
VEFAPHVLDTAAMDKLVIGSVVPRPIAWASSVDAAGVRNLAPFSCARGEEGRRKGTVGGGPLSPSSS